MEDLIFNNGYSTKSFFNLYENILKTLYKRKQDASCFGNHEEKLQFCYKNNEEVNGSVQYKNKRDMICVNVGTVAHVHKMFTLFMCNKNILPNIGDSYKERVVIAEEFKYKLNVTNKELRFSHEPICDVRRKAALILSIMAVRFIIEHELGHVFDGHTQYMENQDINFEFNMCDYGGNDFIKKLELNTLENDADAVAMSSIVDAMLDMYERYSKLTMLNEVIKDKEAIFTLVTFSITSLFLLLEKVWSDKNKVWNKELSLPPMVRHIVNMDAGCRFLENYIKNNTTNYKHDDYLNVEKSMWDGAKEANNAFNHVFKTNINISNKLLKYCDALMYYDEVHKNWENTIDKIEKYSRQALYKNTRGNKI